MANRRLRDAPPRASLIIESAIIEPSWGACRYGARNCTSVIYRIATLDGNENHLDRVRKNKIVWRFTTRNLFTRWQ